MLMPGILFGVLTVAILALVAILFLRKRKTERVAKKSDVTYVCTSCGDSDCECHKLEEGP